jgi:hypothetical protein
LLGVGDDRNSCDRGWRACRIRVSVLLHVRPGDGVEVSVPVGTIAPLRAAYQALSVEPGGLERALLGEVLDIGVGLHTATPTAVAVGATSRLVPDGHGSANDSDEFRIKLEVGFE